ncbi:MAG: glycosyltransferase [Deltaproteobacteria bacterium]|nr:glycosyltransferase [Deltaproteobacteria bacterium]
MPGMPRISIVTPSYNQAAFLEKTILSVLGQGYPNLEYVIMDGGSTDGSVDIIRKYERHLKHWVSEKDKGQTDAVNRGLAMCTGDILDWINSDDRLKPGAFDALLGAVAERPDAGAWVGGCDLVDADGRYISTNRPRGLVREKMADWGGAGHFFQPSCFIARKAWEKHGPLDVWHNMCFDVDFYLKMAREFEFHGVDAVLTEATIHKDAKTQAQKPILRAEIYVMQARHGFLDLARKNIAGAVALAIDSKRLEEELKTARKAFMDAGAQPPPGGLSAAISRLRSRLIKR